MISSTGYKIPLTGDQCLPSNKPFLIKYHVYTSQASIDYDALQTDSCSHIDNNTMKNVATSPVAEYNKSRMVKGRQYS